jgi:aldehyde:ferredoxin oxidoreductase
MWTAVTSEMKRPTNYQLRRVTVDLSREDIRQEDVVCQDLLVFDGKTDMDYWVDAIVNKGPYYTRDDVLGLCKFAGAPDKVIEPVFKDLYGIEVSREDMAQAVQRTYLRGLLLERKQGTTLDDYVLPARVYQHNPNVQLPHFITPEFWQELRQRVFQAFEAQIEHYGLRQAA